MQLNLVYSLPPEVLALVYEYDSTYYEKLNETLRNRDSDIVRLASCFMSYKLLGSDLVWVFREYLSRAMDKYAYEDMAYYRSASEFPHLNWTNGLVRYSDDWVPCFSRVSTELMKFKLLPAEETEGKQVFLDMEEEYREYDGFIETGAITDKLLTCDSYKPVEYADYLGNCVWLVIQGYL